MFLLWIALINFSMTAMSVEHLSIPFPGVSQNMETAKPQQAGSA
jgi:hypothetical protein